MGFLKNKLKDIQRSNEGVKKKWLIALSGISIIIIVLLWTVYMSSFVMNGSGGQTEENVSVDVGFWPVFKNEVSLAAHSIISRIKGILGENDVTITK